MKRKVSNTYFKKSILKCIQNYMIKKENQNLAEKNSSLNKKKIERDFVPVNIHINIDLSFTKE